MKKSNYKIESFKIKPIKKDEMVMDAYVDENGQHNYIMRSKHPILLWDELEK